MDGIEIHGTCCAQEREGGLESLVFFFIFIFWKIGSWEGWPDSSYHKVFFFLF